MIEQLLSETIHWSERGGINAKPGGPVIQTGSDVTPGTSKCSYLNCLPLPFLSPFPFLFLSPYLTSSPFFLRLFPLATTPWFDHFCESYHDNVQVMEHEYIKHYVAGIINILCYIFTLILLL